MKTQKKRLTERLKRSISLLLVITMLLSTVQMPLFAYAQEDTDLQLDPDSLEISSVEKKKDFEDVSTEDWFYEAIQYVYANNLFNGTSETEFSPTTTMTRGMFVTVLGRIAGIDTSKYTENSFDDVIADMYYAPYVAWAEEQGITTGTGERLFSPEIPVSREQMATFMVRFYEAMKYDLPEDVTVTTPKDMEKISEYAKEFVLRLWSAGLLAGDDLGNFNPQSEANRAEVATFAMRTNKHLVSIGVKEDSLSQTEEEDDKPSSGGSSGNNNNDDDDDEVISSGYTMNTNPGEEMVDENPVLTIDEAEQNFEFQVKAEDENALKAALKIYDSRDEELDYTVQDDGNGLFTITPQRVQGTETLNNYQKGGIYNVKLSDEETLFVIDGEEKADFVRALAIFIDQEDLDNMELVDGMKFIELSQVHGLSEEALGGLVTAEIDTQSGDTRSKNNTITGTFTYTGVATIEIGDIVSIYGGTVRPNNRGMDYEAQEGDDIAYVVITDITNDGSNKFDNVYSYRMADAEEVLFMPDMFPVYIGDDEDSVEGLITLRADKANFTNLDGKYPEELGFNSTTTIDIGDFLAIMDTEVTDWDNLANYTGDIQYALIDSVNTNSNTEVVIGYEIMSLDELSETVAYNGAAVTGENTAFEEEQRIALEESIHTQAIESGFIEEAATYLVALAIETDSFKSLSDDMNLEDYEFDFDSANSDDMTTMAGPPVFVSKPEVVVKISDNALTLNDHSPGDDPIEGSVTLGMTFELKYQITQLEYIVIGFSAEFTQELEFDPSAYIGLDWSVAAIIPYPSGIHFETKVDIGTFTSIEIAATAKTFSDNFSWDAVTSLPDGGIDIAKEINRIMQDNGMFEENNNKSLLNQYQSFITQTDVEDSYIELYRQNLARFKFSDPFKISNIIIAADLVLSLNANVSAGITFSHLQKERLTFSFDSSKEQQTKATQVALITPETNFTFYVMGFLGVRAGLELSITAYPLSPSLLTSSFGAQTGVYVHMWGFFFYHYNKTDNVVDSRSMGATYIDIGVYLLIYAAVDALGGAVSMEATIFYDQWSQAEFGHVDNPIGFASDFDNWFLTDVRLTAVRGGNNSILHDRSSIKLEDVDPDLFKIAYVRLYNGSFWAESPESFENFDITFDSDKFTYDKATKTISYDKSTGLKSDRAVGTITYTVPDGYIGAGTFTKTFSVNWTLYDYAHYLNLNLYNRLHYGYLGEEFLGATNTVIHHMIETPGGIGDAIIPDNIRNYRPIRKGYTFGGWYESDDVNKTIVELPEGLTDNSNYTAHWIPKEGDVPVNVRYYVESSSMDYAWDTPYRVFFHNLHETEIHYATLGEDDFHTGYAPLPKPVGPMTEFVAPAELDGYMLNRVEQAELDIWDHYDGKEQDEQIRVYYDAPPVEITLFGETRTYPYGTNLILPSQHIDPELGKGYTLSYESDSDLVYRTYDNTENEDGTMSKTVIETPVTIAPGVRITLLNDIVIKAVATPNTDTPYTVEHVLHTPNRWGVSDYETESLIGTTDAIVDVDSFKLDIVGFEYVAHDSAEGFTSSADTTISGDGNTVVTLVYKQTEENRGKIYWDTGDYDVDFNYGAYHVLVAGSNGELDAVPVVCSDGSQHYYGTGIERPTSIKQIGYIVDGWYLDEAFTEPVTSWLMPKIDVTYYAKISLIDDKAEYTVNHYKEGLNGVYDLVTIEGYKADALSKVTAIAQNYTGFRYNELHEDGKSSGTVTPDGGLVLSMYYDRIEYTVTWDFDNAAQVNQDVKYKYGATVTTPTSITAKDGFVFGGWKNESGSAVNPNGILMGAADVIYTAIWNEEDSQNSTITFDTNGGSAVSPYTALKGADISGYAPTPPTKDDATFDYWMLNGEQYTFTTMPDDDITLMAKWTTSYRIALVGMETDNQEYIGEYMPVQYIDLKYDESFILPEYNGTKFIGDALTGWIDFNEQDKFLPNGTDVEKLSKIHDEILYFYPRPNFYTVYFNMDEGNFANTSDSWNNEEGSYQYSKTVEIGGTITLPDGGEMTRDGNTFSHWELYAPDRDNAIIDNENNIIKPLFHNTNLTTNEDTGQITRPWPSEGGSVQIKPVWTQNQP